MIDWSVAQVEAAKAEAEVEATKDKENHMALAQTSAL